MRAFRSPLRLFVIGIVGVVLLAASADVIFGHWLSTPPENNDGVLTTRGQAQQRGDILWGGAMFATGLMLFGGAFVELVRHRPTIAVNGDGLRIDAGTGDHGLIPWANIERISSGTITDPFDGSTRSQLIVQTRPGTDLDFDSTFVTTNGDVLHIDAQDWTKSVTEVTLAAQGSLDHYLRMEALREYEPPSMVWQAVEESQDGTDEGPSGESEQSVEVEEEE